MLHTCTGVAKINISKLSKESPGISIIWYPWPPKCTLGATVTLPFPEPLLLAIFSAWLSSGGGLNIKYIMMTMAGTPNISDQRKEVLHLQQKKINLIYRILSNSCAMLISYF